MLCLRVAPSSTLISAIEAFGYFTARAFLQFRPQDSMRALILASSSARATGATLAAVQVSSAAAANEAIRFMTKRESCRNLAATTDVSLANGVIGGILVRFRHTHLSLCNQNERSLLVDDSAYCLLSCSPRRFATPPPIVSGGDTTSQQTRGFC